MGKALLWVALLSRLEAGKAPRSSMMCPSDHHVGDMLQLHQTATQATCECAIADGRFA